MDANSTYSVGQNLSDFTWDYAMRQYWKEIADPRTETWFLFTDGPQLMLSIMAFYLLCVKIIGPHLMRDRQPFKLRTTMIVYNIGIAGMNFYSFVRYLAYTDFGLNLFSYVFPPKNDCSPATISIINFGWYYYLSKYVDLLDTVFFVLRKKRKQITGLHLYHHTSVPILGWLAIKIGPTTPPVLMFVLLNSFVHTIMYTYYLLTALGWDGRCYLWLKRYITQIQLIQFALFIAYGCNLALRQTGYPKIWFWIGFMQNPLFFLWFYDFYRNSYANKTKPEKSD